MPQSNARNFLLGELVPRGFGGQMRWIVLSVRRGTGVESVGIYLNQMSFSTFYPCSCNLFDSPAVPSRSLRLRELCVQSETFCPPRSSIASTERALSCFNVGKTRQAMRLAL